MRAVEGKVLRGSYRCTFFLQLLNALNSEYPAQWTQVLETDSTWEEMARHIYLLELSGHNLTFRQVSKRLVKFGINIAPEALEEQIVAGDYPFVLLLQLALAVPIKGFERFVDARDIVQTAGEETSKPSPGTDGVA